MAYLISSNSYYVYTHSYRGKVFYVGSGVRGRAFTLRARGLKWMNYVKTIPNFKVHILAEFNTREEALVYERKQIKKLKPFTNTVDDGTTVTVKPDSFSTITTLSEAGRKGAIALNNKLTPEQKSAAGRRASKARWKKYREEKKLKAKK